jgi:glucose dehydrogenase
VNGKQYVVTAAGGSNYGGGKTGGTYVAFTLP